MGFADRLADDARRVVHGSKTIEEPLVLVDRLSVETNVIGSVNVDSFKTGAGAEVEFNPSLSGLAVVSVSQHYLATMPDEYETFVRRNAERWTIKSSSLEGGMWKFICTRGDGYRRSRVR